MNKADISELFEMALKQKCNLHIVMGGHDYTVTHIQAVHAPAHHNEEKDHDPIYDKYFAIAKAAPRGAVVIVGCVDPGEPGEKKDLIGTLVIDPDAVQAIFLS
ncbi:MAG: hypothetical protein AAFZ67_13965 [Planctomycetota bacterium]